MHFCILCSFEATSDENLNMHILKKHDECVLCEVTCKGRTKLIKHMQSHRQISYKHCGKKIPYNSKTNHLRQCIGERIIKCENSGIATFSDDSKWCNILLSQYIAIKKRLSPDHSYLPQLLSKLVNDMKGFGHWKEWMLQLGDSVLIFGTQDSC